MRSLVLRYIGGLAIGVALIGAYTRLRAATPEEPTVLPSRGAAPASVPPVEVSAPAAPAPFAELPDESAAATEIPPACAEFVRVMERYAECKEVPEAARAQFRQALDVQRASFADLKDLGGAAHTLANGCEQATDAILESGKSMGCEM